MKKLLTLLLTLVVAFALPCVVLGAQKVSPKIDDTKKVADGVVQDDGTVLVDHAITIKTTEAGQAINKDLVFVFVEFGPAITRWDCVASDKFTVTKGETEGHPSCTFTPKEDVAGETISVGTLNTYVDKDKTDCHINYYLAFDGTKINPPTGSSVSYVIVGAGVVAAAAAYVVSKKRSKLYNV